MREIKFRLWSNGLKVMYTPDNEIGGLWSIPMAPNGVIKPTYKDDILMQFTGRKDKNGKEIYAGDVVKASPKAESNSKGDKYKIGNRIYLVSYESGSFWIDSEKKDLDVFSFIDINLTDFEVIGNIYENPELIR